jgi:hypothetical protein
MKTININGKEYSKEDFKKENEGLDAFIDYWDWEAAVDSSFDALLKFPRHEPEPPTVRPMSELPEGNKRFLFKVEVDKSYIEHVTGRAIINKESAYVSLDNYNSVIPLVENPKRIRQILGWLPLPNPNDIKP